MSIYLRISSDNMILKKCPTIIHLCHLVCGSLSLKNYCVITNPDYPTRVGLSYNYPAPRVLFLCGGKHKAVLKDAHLTNEELEAGGWTHP